jgi:hypothetical protein
MNKRWDPRLFFTWYVKKYSFSESKRCLASIVRVYYTLEKQFKISHFTYEASLISGLENYFFPDFIHINQLG